MAKMTFIDFLKKIHGLTYVDYLALNDYQKKALDIEYRENWR